MQTFQMYRSAANVQYVCLSPMCLQDLQAAFGKLLESAPSMLLLVTSRDSVPLLALRCCVHRHAMEPLASADAQDLVRRVSLCGEPAILEILARHCGNNPFALCLVSKIIAETHITPQVSNSC